MCERYLDLVEPQDQLRVAREGSQHQRWQLAGREGLSIETFELLAHDPDAHVRASLLVDNYETPEHVVEHLAAESNEFAELARYHPNASCERLDTGVLRDHILTTIHRYLDRKGATPDQRREVYRAMQDERSTETLGAVWRRISADAR